MLEHTLISGEYTIESYLVHFHPNLLFAMRMVIGFAAICVIWWIVKKIMVWSY